MRFADINGDGRDDYLVVDAAGVAKAWTNNGEVRKGWRTGPQAGRAACPIRPVDS